MLPWLKHQLIQKKLDERFRIRVTFLSCFLCGCLHSAVYADYRSTLAYAEHANILLPAQNALWRDPSRLLFPIVGVWRAAGGGAPSGGSNGLLGFLLEYPWHHYDDVLARSFRAGLFGGGVAWESTMGCRQRGQCLILWEGLRYTGLQP